MSPTEMNRQDPAGVDETPRMSRDEMYRLIRLGNHVEFNRRRSTGQAVDLRGTDLRNLDLRKFDLAGLDLSNCYLRQADLRGQNLTSCRLEGASIHSARISGAFLPAALPAEEIRLSRDAGTRMRYAPGSP